MYTSMTQPSHFHVVLALSFTFMFAIYAVVGACGYYLYGAAGHVRRAHHPVHVSPVPSTCHPCRHVSPITPSTCEPPRPRVTRPPVNVSLAPSTWQVLITEDMSEQADGPLASLLVTAVIGGITFKIFASVPMCIVVLTDIAENL